MFEKKKMRMCHSFVVLLLKEGNDSLLLQLVAFFSMFRV
jgi:hypothetical protein